MIRLVIKYTRYLVNRTRDQREEKHGWEREKEETQDKFARSVAQISRENDVNNKSNRRCARLQMRIAKININVRKSIVE